MAGETLGGGVADADGVAEADRIGDAAGTGDGVCARAAKVREKAANNNARVDDVLTKLEMITFEPAPRLSFG